ncbi:MAG: hypothetical protein BWY70_01071 [Bacteroidetes bacterium ADurb.Bin408]|nr:MAG: hypothetical protein BWY70_01071 [Bacteroidetes bacterium ADurb.Bin408]
MSKIIVTKLTEKEITDRKIKSWPIWSKEISRFSWTYDSDEECQILEGEFRVETAEGIFEVKAGDFVVFKKGLECVWDITKPVRKHYNFPE